MHNAIGHFTPSNFPYWRGTEQPGKTFTVEQDRAYEAERAERHRIPENPELFICQFYVDGAAGTNGLPRIARFKCPLLVTTSRGRLVITPSGQKKWIDRKGLNE